MNNIRITVLWSALALVLTAATVLRAQEDTPAEPEAAQEQAETREAEEGRAVTERELTPEELTPDIFDPTEEVSEDLPVAFPVDI